LRGAQRRGNPGGGSASHHAVAIRKAIWIAAGPKSLVMTMDLIQVFSKLLTAE
jgi:hypothetical protein